MNKSSPLMISLTALLALASSLATTSAAASKVTIYADGKHILSGRVITFELHDEVCNVTMGPYRLAGNQKIPIQVCADNIGKGEVLFRAEGRSGWTRQSFLENGESFYP